MSGAIFLSCRMLVRAAAVVFIGIFGLLAASAVDARAGSLGSLPKWQAKFPNT